MVEQEGRLGRKNGKGFYDYPADGHEEPVAGPGGARRQRQLDPDTIDVEELKQRFLVTQAVEAARTMVEGVVTDPREADVGSILGFGFAPFTGGTLSYIDGMGDEGLRRALRRARGQIRRALRAAAIAARHGGEGRDLLRTVHAAEKGGLITIGVQAACFETVASRPPQHEGCLFGHAKSAG